MYEVALTDEALRMYRKANAPLVRKLNRCFYSLSRNPHTYPNIKRLTGTLRGRWRYRVGDWRVVYQIDEQRRRVNVLVIAHRSSVYD